MEMVYLRELGLSAAPKVKAAAVQHLSLPEALALYQRLKGAEKTKLFLKVQNAAFGISLIVLVMIA